MGRNSESANVAKSTDMRNGDRLPLLTPGCAAEDDVHGEVEAGYDPVVRVFASNFKKGLDTGAAFCAYYKGRPVVDVWGGYKDATTHALWGEDTMTMAMSSTKAVVAVSLAHLADRGRLDYSRQVAHYWPEFAQNGKQNITVEQLVSHQAGLIAVRGDVVDMGFVRDPTRISKALAAQTPLWKPGSCHGYHMATMGWYIDQIVRRVDERGRDVATYFRDEISEPFDIDFYIGLPISHDHRVARIESREWQGLRHQFIHYNRQFWNLTLLALRCNSFYNKAIHVGSSVHALKILNSRQGREAVMPHVNGIGTSRSLAKLFGVIANGGYDHTHGSRLLSPEMCDRLMTPVTRGVDRVYRVPQLFSVFSVGLELREEGDRLIAGHPGYGGQAVYMDPANHLAWCYLTNRLCLYGTPDQDPRYRPIIDKLIKCLQDNAIECNSL